MGQLIGRGDYAEALLAAMADGSRADGPRVGSPVRPLDSARSFAERFRRQRERRAARELLNAARLEGRADARRLARDADRAIATPIVGAEGPRLGPGLDLGLDLDANSRTLQSRRVAASRASGSPPTPAPTARGSMGIGASIPILPGTIGTTTDATRYSCRLHCPAARRRPTPRLRLLPRPKIWSA